MYIFNCVSKYMPIFRYWRSLARSRYSWGSSKCCIKIFKTDTGAALRAAETDAEVILLAKTIDGVYSADPKQDINAVKYDEISYLDTIGVYKRIATCIHSHEIKIGSEPLDKLSIVVNLSFFLCSLNLSKDNCITLEDLICPNIF